MSPAKSLKQIKTTFYQTQIDYPPDVLRQKARDIAASFGYGTKPADTPFWLSQRLDLLLYLDGRQCPRDWPRWLGSETPFSFTGDIATSLNWKGELVVDVPLFAALMFVLLRLGIFF